MSNFDTIMNIVRGGSAGSTPRKRKNSNFDNIMSIVRGESSYTQPAQTAYTQPAQTAYTPDAAARSIYENQMQTYFNQRTADVEARRKGEEYDTSGFAATEAAIRANPLFSDYEDQFDNLLGNISFNEDLNTYTARQQQNLASGREHINDPEAARLEKRLKEDPRWAEVSKEVDSFISGLKENRKARAAMAEALGVDFGEVKSALGLVTENGEYKSGEQLANDIIGLLGEREEAGKESYESSRNFFTDALLGLIPGASLATMGGRIKDARNEEEFEKNKQERIDGINRNIDILTKFAHTFAGSEFEEALYRRQQEGQTRLAEFAGQAAAAQNEEDSRAAKSAAEAEAKSLKELQKLLSGYGTTQEQLLSLNAEEIQKKIDELEKMKLQDPEGAYESEAARQRNIENTNAQMGIYSENAGWEALAANERDTALSLNSYIDSEISRLGQLKRLAENLKKTEEMQKSAEKLPAAELTEESLSLLGEEDRLMLSYMLGGRDAAEGVQMDTESKALERVSEGMSDMQREEYLSGLELEAENRRSSIIERIEAQASVRNTAEMTETEKQTYAKLFLNKGAAAAAEYLDAMQDTLNARAGSKAAESVKGKWLAEGMAAFGGGVDQFFSGISQRLDTQLQPISKAQYASAEIRENLEKNEKSTALYDITSSVGNMAPAIAGSILLTSALGPAGLGLSATAASTIGSAASSVMMGASASGNAYAEALRQGYSEEQANSYSIMVGASEAALQYALGGISKLGGALGLGKIGTKIISRLGGTATRLAGNAFVQTAVKIAGNAVSEGIEEYLQTHLEKMFRNISFYEDNEIDPFDEEAIYSGVLGMITGGLLESFGTIRETGAYKELGGELTAKGLKAGIVDAAINSELETASLARLLKDGKIRGIGNESYALGKIAEEFMQADAEGWQKVIEAAPAERIKNSANAKEGALRAMGINPESMSTDEMKAQSAKNAETAQARINGALETAKGENTQGAVLHVDKDGNPIVELTEKQEAMDRIYRAMSDYSGLNIVLMETAPQNGWFDSMTDTVYIAEDADNGHLTAAAHELTHFFKKWAPEQYNDLKGFIVDSIENKSGGTFDALVKNKQYEYGKQGVKLNYIQATDEVVAEACRGFLDGTGIDTLMKLAEQKPDVFYRVGEFLKGIIANIKKAIKGAKSSAEAEMLRDTLGSYEKAQEKWLECFDKAAENYKRLGMDTELSREMGGGREYQARIGTTQDGRGIYTSNFPEGSTREQRQNRILELISDVWSKKPINLEIVKNGKKKIIVAQFDPTIDTAGTIFTDATKLAFGNRKGTMSDQKVTEKLADDFPEIIADSKFVKSKDETGKDTFAHKDVKVWHYFANNIVFLNEKGKYADYNINIDVKEKQSGNYVYSFAAEKIKGSERNYEPNLGNPKTLLASVKTDTDTKAYVSDDINIPQNTDNSQQNVEKNEDLNYDNLIKKPDMKIVELSETEIPTIKKKGKRGTEGVDSGALSKISLDKANTNISEGYSQKYVYIKDINSNVLLNRNGISHGLQGNITKSSTVNTALITYELPDILRNSIKINEYSPREGNLGSDILIGYARHKDGREFIVKSTITKTDTNKSLVESVEIYDVLKGSKAKETTKSRLRSSSTEIVDANPAADSSVASIISIESLLELVKDNYPELLSKSLIQRFGLDESSWNKDLVYSLRENGRKSTLKHLDLTVQTMYGGISKKSLTTATDEHASVNTSETLSGTALNNNISQNADNSQENVENKKSRQVFNANALNRTPEAALPKDSNNNIPQTGENSQENVDISEEKGTRRTYDAEAAERAEGVYRTAMDNRTAFAKEHKLGTKEQRIAKLIQEGKLYAVPRSIRDLGGKYEANVKELAKLYGDVINAREELQRVNPQSELLSTENNEDASLSEIRSEAMRLWDAKYYADRAEEQFLKEHELTKEEKDTAKLIANGAFSAEWQSWTDMPVDELNGYADILKQKKNATNELQAFKRKTQEGYFNIAEKITRNAGDWVSPQAIINDLNTMQRNARRWAKYDPEGQAAMQELFSGITKHNAERTRYVNKIADELNAKKFDALESAFIQAVGEGEENGGLSIDLIPDRLEYNGYLLKERVQEGISILTKAYAQMYNDVQNALAKAGYQPAGYIANYFPHVGDGKDALTASLKKLGMDVAEGTVVASDISGKIEKISALASGKNFNAEALKSSFKGMIGLEEIMSDRLNTGITGDTENYKPGKKWAAYLLKRYGENSNYNALKGFDAYAEAVSRVIFHTDDIKTLRATTTLLREKFSPETVREQIQAVRSMETDINGKPISEEMRQAEIERILDKAGKVPNEGIIKSLEEYANLLAGKKSRYDRAAEYAIGRKGMLMAGKIMSWIGRNMIAFNPATAITNILPIGQVMGEVDTASLAKATRETMKNMFKKDGFSEQSDFIVNRQGINKTWKTRWDKFDTAAFWMMTTVDEFSTQVVTRAYYNDALSKGMSADEAMSYANERAGQLMGDRSLGAQPNIFSSNTMKVLTQFQFENFNFFYHYFKDMPAEYRRMGASSAALSMTKTMIGLYLANGLLRAIRGRGGTLDPIDLLLGLAKGGKDEEDEKDWWECFKQLATDIAEELPVIGTALGGGRYPITTPISSWDSFEDFFERMGSWDTPGKRERNIEDIMDVFGYLNPIGGYSQLKKNAKGLKAVIEGGVYGESGGEKYLKYPVANGWEAAQNIIFGTSSTKSAQDYYAGYDTAGIGQTALDIINGESLIEAWEGDGGLKQLTAEETEYYRECTAEKMDRREFVLLAARMDALSRDERAQYISAEYAEHEDFLYEAFVFNDQMREQFDRTAGSLKAKAWYELHTAESMTDDQTDAEVKAQMADGYGLSEAETERIYYNEVLSESQRDTLDGLNKQGVEISAKEFFEISSAKALKDEYGDNISGSKQAAKAEAINELGIGFADAGKVAEAVGLDEKDLYSAFEPGETPEAKKAVIEACTAAGMSEEAAKNFYKQIKSADKPEKMRLITENKALNEQQKAKAAAAAFTSDKEKAVYELAVSTGAMGSKLMKVYAEFKMEETGKGENLSREEMKSFLAKKGLNVWQVNTIYLLEASDKKEYNRRLNVMLQKAQMSADKKMEIKGVLWRK